MPVNVGGLNVSIGIDLSKLNGGLDAAKNSIQSFEGELRKIRLEKAIKGNPFGATNQYLKASSKEIKTVFDEWANSTKRVGNNMDVLANKAKINAAKVIATWGKLQETQKKNDGLLGVKKEIISLEKGAKVRAKTWFGLEGGENLIKYLKEIKEATPGATKGIDDLLKILNSLKHVTKKQLTSYMGNAIQNIKTYVSSLNTEFGNTLKSSNKLQEGLKFASQVKKSGSTDEALERRKQLKREILIEDVKSRKEILLGINVEKNRLAILERLEKRKVAGIELTKKQSAALKEYYDNELVRKRASDIRELRSENEKLNVAIKAGIDVKENERKLGQNAISLQQKGQQLTLSEIQAKEKLRVTELAEYEIKQKIAVITRQDQQMHKIDLQLASSYTELTKRRAATIRALSVEEARLNANIKYGFNVKQSRLALDKNYIAQSKAGVKVTAQKIVLEKELANVAARSKQAAKEKKDDGFLSASWFKSRAKWFIQLRGFWAIWRGGTEAFRIIKQFEEELKNLQAVTRSSNKELDLMKTTIKDIASTTAVKLVTIAEGMVKLGQAGLSVAEANAAIKDVSILAVATMTDMTTASDLTTTAMRAWGIAANDTQHITDVLANAVNNSKVTIEGLSTALQYLTGVAPQVGLSFQETTAAIGILANQGIKLSKIGTGLRSLLGELLKPSERFEKELNKVGVTIQEVDVATVDFIKIMETLSNSGFNAASAFRGLDRRSASAVSALIKQGGRIREFSDSLSEIGVASEMAATQMEALNKKVIVTSNNFVILAGRVYDAYKPLMKLSMDVLGGLAKGMASTGKAAGYLSEGLSYLVIGGGISLFIGSMTEGIKLSTKLATAFKLLKASVAFLFTPLGASIALVTAALIGAIAIFAKFKYEISNLKDEADAAKNKFIELNSKYEKFIDLSKEYLDAREKGNTSIAKSISQQDKELRQIYDLNLSREIEAKRIKEVTDSLKAQVEAQKKLSNTQNAIILNKLVRKVQNEGEDIELSKRATKNNVSFSDSAQFLFSGSNVKNKKEEEDFKRRQKELVQDTIRTFQDKVRTILAGNDETIKSQEGIIKSLKEEGYNYENILKLFESTGDKAPWENWLKDIIKDVDNSEKKTSEWLLRLEKIKKLKPEEYNKADTGALFDSLKAQDTFKKFAEQDEEGYKRLREVFIKNPEEIVKTLEKLEPVLEQSYTELATSISGSYSKRFGINLSDEMIAFLTNKAFINNIRKALSDVIKFDEKDMNLGEVVEKARARVDIIGKKSLDIEKEVAKVRERIRADQYKVREDAEKVEELRKIGIQGVKKLRDEDNRLAEQRNENLRNEIAQLENLDEHEANRLNIQGEYNDKLKEANEYLLLFNESLSKTPGDTGLQLRIDKLNEYIRLLKIEQGFKLDKNDIAKARESYRIEAENATLGIAKRKIDIQIETPNDKESLAKAELDLLDIQQKRINKDKLENLDKKKRADLLKEEKQLHIDIIQATETLKRASNPLYDIYRRIGEEIKGWKEITSDIGVNIYNGLTGITADYLKGFPEAKQEAANLKGELKNLKAERDDLAYKGIVTDEEAERFRQLNEEIHDTKSSIEDLESPLKNLKESFKDFFKSVIEGIADIIAQQLAANAVKGIAGLLGSIFASSATSAATVAVAKGGVFSNGKITPMASGGIVTKPTMFPMADGTGLMGEAGPEAVMPLKRLPNGNLGVGAQSSAPNMEINVINKTGKNADASADQPRFDGEKWVMTVVLDAANRNRNSFGTGLKTALNKV